MATSSLVHSADIAGTALQLQIPLLELDAVAIEVW